jgi:hypothetical protein
MVTAAALALTLGMIFPVQYVLDTAGYRRTSAKTWAPITATQAQVPKISGALGNASVVLVQDTVTEVSAQGRTISPVSVWALLGTNHDTEVTLMPEATKVAGAPRPVTDDSDWIDINSDIATALRVGPGDEVDVLIQPHDRREFRVRGVYAVREDGFPGVAMASADALFSPSGGEIQSTSMVTTASTKEVRHLLNTPPWRDRMVADGYSLPMDAETNDERIRRAEEDSFADLSLVFTVCVLALSALIAIIIGESAAIMREFRSRAARLVDLGARPSSVHRGALVMVSGVALLSLPLGGWMGTFAYSWGIAGPGIPPSLLPAWWCTTALGAIAACATALLNTRPHRRRDHK